MNSPPLKGRSPKTGANQPDTRDQSLLAELAGLEAVLAMQSEIAAGWHSLGDTLQGITERAVAVTDADLAFIEMVEDGDLVCLAAAGGGVPFVGLRIPIEGTLSGLCLRSRTILRSDDVESDSRVNMQLARQVGVRSLLLVPLVHRDEGIGVLVVGASQPAAFSDHHERLLRALPALLGSAIGYARLLETEAERDRALAQGQLLQRITASANQARLYQDVLERTFEEVCDFLDWPVGHAYRLDTTADVLVSAGYWCGHGEEPYADFRVASEATQVQRGEGLVGRVWERGIAEWVLDVSQEPEFARSREAAAAGLKTMLVIPVTIRDEVVAVMEFFAPGAREPDSLLLDFMTNVGTQLGIVIEREQAVATLAASEERFRAIAETANDAIVTADSNDCILYVNPRAEVMFGYASGELLGESLLRLMPERFHELHTRGLARFLRTREPRLLGQTVEVAGRRKDGSELPLEVSLSQWETESEFYFIGMMRDLTIRNEMKHRLQLAERMEVVGRLAGGVAHDFNNMLTAIQGYSELLLGEPDLKGEPRQYVEEILKAGRQSAAMTSKLLALSRHPMLGAQVTDPNAVISDMQTTLSQLIGERVVMEASLAADLGCVFCDQGQLEQVVLNLVINARDAMPEGGRIAIETKNVELDAAAAHLLQEIEPGPYVELRVRDSGQGMEPETIPRIFEAFFTTKGPGEGTGLGLATVQEIVRQCGGGIAVESAPDLGATFSLYFPLVDSVALKPAAAVDELASDASGRTILLAEDEDVVSGMVAQVMRRRGFQVLEAASGGAALEAARAHPDAIDLLVTDVVMPKMSGPQLARELIAQRPDMRVLFLSGYTQDLLGSEGMVRTMTNYLQKPFTSEQLARKVQAVLAERRRLA